MEEKVVTLPEKVQLIADAIYARHHVKPRKAKSIKSYQMDFCMAYACTGDSLSSYIDTHKHIIKVYASNLLTNIEIWQVIFELYRDNPDTPYKQTLIREYDTFKARTGTCPFKAMERYQWSFRKHRNPDPVEVIGILLRLYRFFNILDRQHFLSKIVKSLRREFKYVKDLDIDNMNKSLSRLCAELQKDGINYKAILEHGNSDE